MPSIMHLYLCGCLAITASTDHCLRHWPTALLSPVSLPHCTTVPGVIRVERVSEITSHLKLHRRDFGLPTAMVVRGKLLAVGTSQGVVNVSCS